MDKPKVKIELGEDLDIEITATNDDKDALLVTFSMIAGAMSNVILAKYGSEQAAQWAQGGAVAGSLVMAIAGNTYFNGENVAVMCAERVAKDKEQTEPIKEYKEKKDDE